MKKILLFSLFLLAGCSNKTTTNNATNTTENRVITSGLAYHQAHGEDSICVASVCLENDVIQSAHIDELTYLSHEEYQGLITSQETTTQKHIASKTENSEAYSQAMQINGATHSIKENYQAICDYVKGKTVTELESELNGKTEEEMVDAVSGCTLTSTKGYLEAIVKACREAK